MIYSQFLFERFKSISKLPTNRRSNYRRVVGRRHQRFQIGHDNRNLKERRANDRRSIQVEITVNCDHKALSSSFLDFQIVKQAFPNVDLVRKRAITTAKYIIDWRIQLEDGDIFVQTEVDRSGSDRFITFQQLKGDFQALVGEIELIPDHFHTKIRLAVIIEPGLPSFEAILGNAFKEKIKDIVKAGLQRLSAKNGGIVEAKSDFGFLIHTIPDYFAKAFSDTSYARMPDALFKFIVSQLPPFKSAHVTGVKSIATGTAIEGDLIYSPYAPSHFLHMNKRDLFQHILEAGQIAKDLGAKILGLGAYTAFVGKRGVEIASELQIPVTTGTAYTIATALQAVERAAEYSGLPLSEATITIVGATGSIGKTCAELISSKVKRLILVARNLHRLKDFAHSLNTSSKKMDVTFTHDINDALSQSNLILLSTNTPETLIDIRMVSSGSIVCDISQPRNVSIEDASLRDDILLIDGGVVEPPGNPNFNIYFGLPPGLTYACLGETMVLALENKFESYSIGGNISAEKVLKISELANKHGFKLAELKSFGNFINPRRFKQISNARVTTHSSS